MPSEAVWDFANRDLPGAGTSTLNITVGSTVTAGTYTITVTGVGGTLTHSATVGLTVTTVGGGGTTQILGNPGFETIVATPWTATAGVVTNSATRKTTNVWYQTSADNGATWSAATKLTTATTNETIAGADSGNQYGDYNSLSIYAGKIFPSWTDRRSGAKEEIWTVPVVEP